MATIAASKRAQELLDTVLGRLHGLASATVEQATSNSQHQAAWTANRTAMLNSQQ